MKIFAFFAVFFISSAYADQFRDYSLQNNFKQDMKVLTGEAYELYHDLYEPSDIFFGESKWLNDVGVAPFTLTTEKHTYKGYMAFLVNDEGLVESLMWTHGEPATSWTTWDLEIGQAADVGSTLVAFSQGFVEANPLAQGAAFPAVVAVKLAGSYYMKRHSLQTCQSAVQASGIGFGTAALNGITIAVGSFAPWALIPAAGIAYATTPDRNEAFWDCVRVFAKSGP